MSNPVIQLLHFCEAGGLKWEIFSKIKAAEAEMF